jgi:hypothetical protein
MYRTFALFAAPLFAAGMLFGMSRPADKTPGGMKEEIRVMPVARTPESNTILLAIAIPKNGEVVRGNPIWSQFRIEGFALGSDSSQFERSNEVPVSSMGQTVHVVVDNRPYFPINEPAINPFNEEGYYYITGYKFEMPFSLKDGMHTIRMFPARSFGESLKGSNTFSAITFYVGDQTSKSFDFSQPFLTYNEPSGLTEWREDQPVLLDFLIANCELSPDGYTVQLTIDGMANRTLSSWQPYYIYGLKKGKHTIRLELLNRKTKVGGPFNDVEQTIVVH